MLSPVRLTRVFVLSALFIAITLPALADDRLTIATDSGPIHGKESGDGKVRIFLGIPFAAPPVGPLRWKPPQPVAPWKDVKETTAFGPRCMQPDVMKSVTFRDPGPSEDCLTLNVWAPKDAAKLPVMVWIYGGAFLIGGSAQPAYDGDAFARRGIVVVTLNYRLGVFGFFGTSELAAESPQHAAGNYGFLDQNAALQWVQRNIAAFGGDPGNVTIFGESAGGVAINAHMASPLSRGLFHKAIGESGGGPGKSSVPYPSLATTEKDDEKFARNTLKAENLAALRAIPAADLLSRSSPKLFSHIPAFGPNVDGYFLTDSVTSTFAAGKQASVPLLAGFNADEASFESVSKLDPNYNVQKLNFTLFQKFGLHAGEAQKYFHATNNEEAVRAADTLLANEFLVYSDWLWMEDHVNAGFPVYRYFFALPAPPDDIKVGIGYAYHSDELEYVFGTLDARPGAKWRPEDRRLSDQMQAYWVNFARTGNPNGEGLPNWPAYTRDSWQMIVFDAAISARPDDHRDRYLFLQKYWK